MYIVIENLDMTWLNKSSIKTTSRESMAKTMTLMAKAPIGQFGYELAIFSETKSLLCSPAHSPVRSLALFVSIRLHTAPWAEALGPFPLLSAGAHFSVGGKAP